MRSSETEVLKVTDLLYKKKRHWLNVNFKMNWHGLKIPRKFCLIHNGNRGYPGIPKIWVGELLFVPRYPLTSQYQSHSILLCSCWLKTF